MYAVTKVGKTANWELIAVFGGWIAFEVLILLVCTISMS